MKLVYVYEHKKSYGDNPPYVFIDYIKWLKNKLESVPEEYRNSVIIDIKAHLDEEDESYTDMNIYYFRRETEQEKQEREEECRKEAIHKRNQELKEKYENNGN